MYGLSLIPTEGDPTCADPHIFPIYFQITSSNLLRRGYLYCLFVAVYCNIWIMTWNFIFTKCVV